ncbi:DSS1/SEM1 family-domain-containing protein [Xylaria venustula]|nr:DSS1/SEM1 family-domain-containing protein [Xylaria venustula]
MAAPTDKPADKSAATSEAKPEQPTPQKSTAALEEDDEFEDFPVEGAPSILFPIYLSTMTFPPPPQQQRIALRFSALNWPAEETESAAQTASGNGTTQHLWEESWDDDDTSDDFSAQLREEIKKVEASKRR